MSQPLRSLFQMSQLLKQQVERFCLFERSSPVGLSLAADYSPGDSLGISDEAFLSMQERRCAL